MSIYIYVRNVYIKGSATEFQINRGLIHSFIHPFIEYIYMIYIFIFISGPCHNTSCCRFIYIRSTRAPSDRDDTRPPNECPDWREGKNSRRPGYKYTSMLY